MHKSMCIFFIHWVFFNCNAKKLLQWNIQSFLEPSNIIQLKYLVNTYVNITITKLLSGG